MQAVEFVTDWIKLWCELVEAQHEGWQVEGQVDADVWRAKARAYHETVMRRWATPDSSRDFIAADLNLHSNDTVIDVGAGSGSWTVFLARMVRHVTAIDPSPAMLEVLHENVAAASLSNVSIMEGGWMQVNVAPHDVVLCAHAIYGTADIQAFVKKMEAAARRRCYLLLRTPLPNGVMAEAACHIWGQPYDSANFQVAYNALLQMGICANVLFEDSGCWQPWTNASLDEALADVKRRFALQDSSEHDVFLRDLLDRRLVREQGQLVWPGATRSALVYWDVRAS
ncbi:MAG: protein-L-isoaspartate O-methyltransferase [Chloroflexi bacterium ADurb.Bin360]|nr:MAG: protein-L-isoaspartate O-methyltransferase [Chloroflexi bacterium ADurb.Bin360]